MGGTLPEPGNSGKCICAPGVDPVDGRRLDPGAGGVAGWRDIISRPMKFHLVPLAAALLLAGCKEGEKPASADAGAQPAAASTTAKPATTATTAATGAPAATTSSEMKTTASGLKYTVLKQGTGTQSPKATDSVKVHYHGTLLDGTVFDSSVARGQPISFPLNRVIKGWTEGVQLMKVGDKFKFEIPPDLAYGPNSPSPKIPANSTLVFEVELLGIE